MTLAHSHRFCQPCIRVVGHWLACGGWREIFRCQVHQNFLQRTATSCERRSRAHTDSASLVLELLGIGWGVGAWGGEFLGVRSIKISCRERLLPVSGARALTDSASLVCTHVRMHMHIRMHEYTCTHVRACMCGCTCVYTCRFITFIVYRLLV